jgi:FAD/FMN-containing dehydrogenase
MRSLAPLVAGDVEVDPDRRVARIPAGTRWRQVIDAAAAHGLTALHEPVPSRDAVRDILRGGLSFHGRRHGLAVSAVRSVELMLADGESERVDAATDPELFWALRGEGGLGNVQAVEIALFPAVAAFAGAAWWPLADAPKIVAAWHRWTLAAPLEITTALRITPEGVCVDGAVLAESAGECMSAVRIGTDMLGRLRAIAPPVRDSWTLGAPDAAVRDPAEVPTSIGDHLLLDGFDGAGRDEVLRAAAVLESVELRQLGGAFAAPSRIGGAFHWTDASFVYRGAGTPTALARVRGALTPWAAAKRDDVAVYARLG